MLGRVALRDDGHGIVVLLAVEDDVETRLVELLHGDAVGALGEHLHLIDAELIVTLLIRPLALPYLRRRNKAENL